MVDDTGLERLEYYMVPEKREHRVVQVVELDDRFVVAREAETAVEHTVRRDPLETRLNDGRVQRVVPRWEPAGQPVEV